MLKRKIRAKKILQDVRAGLDDSQLVEKYEISSRTLQYVFRKLVQAGLMTDLEYYERSKLTESDVFRAFSEEPDAVLRCPDCGEPLPEHGGGECMFCQTMDGTTKNSPTSAVFGKSEKGDSSL